MKAAVLLPLLLITAAHAQEERVAEIRKWYQSVQDGKAANERKIAFEADGEPFSGDLVTREFKGGLKSVTVSYVAGDHGGSEEHYYFKDGELFFAFVVQSSWRFAGGTEENPETEDTRKEIRYYFDGDACIRQLERSATDKNADKLAAAVAKLEQKKVEPGDDAETIRNRGIKLLAAKDAAAVMAAFD